MQNNAETRIRPSLQEFTKMIEAFRRRVPRNGFRTNHEYAAKLIELGMGLDSVTGKEIVIVMLGALALVGTAMCDDLSAFLGVACNEIQMRALYDDDYKTMDEFMRTIQERAVLAEQAKNEAFKILSVDILKKFMKDENERSTAAPDAAVAGVPASASQAP